MSVCSGRASRETGHYARLDSAYPLEPAVSLFDRRAANAERAADVAVPARQPRAASGIVRFGRTRDTGSVAAARAATDVLPAVVCAGAIALLDEPAAATGNTRVGSATGPHSRLGAGCLRSDG
jgi:hypothetical protein